MKTENLIREVREILEGGVSSISQSKKVIYDKKTKQYSIKIPKELSLAAGLTPKKEIKIVINPSEKEIMEASLSQIIIYGKEKETATK